MFKIKWVIDISFLCDLGIICLRKLGANKIIYLLPRMLLSFPTCTYSAQFFNGKHSGVWKFTFFTTILCRFVWAGCLLPYIIVKTSSVSSALLFASEWHLIWIKFCFMNLKLIRYLTVYLLSSNGNSAYLEMFRNFVC